MFTQISIPATFSGMKAHVFAADMVTTDEILDTIEDLIEDLELGCKMGTEAFFSFAGPGHPQHGKGVTVYFPRIATYKRDLARLVIAVDGLSAGTIAGDMMVSANVGVRCEVREDTPARDLAHDEYQMAYISSY